MMVMSSGRGNFVYRINLAEGIEEPDWLGMLVASLLDLKLATSIVAISSIHLPRVFMKLAEIPNHNTAWQALAHLTFLVSAELVSVMARAAFASGRH